MLRVNDTVKAYLADRTALDATIDTMYLTSAGEAMIVFVETEEWGELQDFLQASAGTAEVLTTPIAAPPMSTEDEDTYTTSFGPALYAATQSAVENLVYLWRYFGLS